MNKKNQAEVLRPPGLSQLESDKKTPHEFQELKQGTTPRETGERKRKVSQVAINEIRVLLFELEKIGVLKIVKCWNICESFYGTRHSERISRLYQQRSTNFNDRSGSILSGVRFAV